MILKKQILLQNFILSSKKYFRWQRNNQLRIEKHFLLSAEFFTSAFITFLLNCFTVFALVQDRVKRRHLRCDVKTILLTYRATFLTIESSVYDGCTDTSSLFIVGSCLPRRVAVLWFANLAVASIKSQAVTQTAERGFTVPRKELSQRKTIHDVISLRRLGFRAACT